MSGCGRQRERERVREGATEVQNLCKNKFTHDYKAAEVTTASARLIKLKQNGAGLHKFQQAL